MRIEPPGYQRNYDWAVNNKSKGFYSSGLAIGSTISGCVKAYSDKDSRTYKVFSLLEKLFYSLSNSLQYFLFDRKDDVLEYDNLNNPVAASVGKVASFTEKYIEPIAKPATVFLEPSLQEASNDALSFFDTLYWKLRFIVDKVSFKNFKLLPPSVKKLFNKKLPLYKKARATNNIIDIIMPTLGFTGSACIGTFTPIKIFLNLVNKESKIVNSLGAIGKVAINILYFFKFTLEFYWNSIIKKDKSCQVFFALGTTANVLNTALPVIELLSKQGDSFLDKFSRGWKSLANNLLLLFWGLRRYHMGKEWLENSIQGAKS